MPGARAVTYKAVPAIPAAGIVLAGVAVTLLAAHTVTEGFHTSSVLCLRQLTDVLAATINEQVADAAHISVVQHGCPQLGGKDESSPVFRETPQVHVTFQVQNLAFSAGCEWSALSVHRDGACTEKRSN